MFVLRARQFIKNVLRCLRRLLVGEQQLLAPAEKFPKHRLSMLCGATAGISFIPGCDPRLFIRSRTPRVSRFRGEVLLPRVQRLPSHPFFVLYGV